jgi:CRP-like cAMP-binding protein
MAGSQHSQSARRKMARTDDRRVDDKPVQNAILQGIPEREFLLLKPHLSFAEFKVAEYLHRQGNPITDAIFLNEGIGAMVIETSDARSVEVGTAGYECMIGLPIAVGLHQATYSILIQAPGHGFRVPVKAIKRVLPSAPELHQMLLRRLAIRYLLQVQNTACNRLHSLTQRLARWLLLMQDRLAGSRIATTHDIVSKMMGTDRATVSLAIADFERRGILRRGRGSLTIINRLRLRERSCECYKIFSEFNSELGLRTSAR